MHTNHIQHTMLEVIIVVVVLAAILGVIGFRVVKMYNRLVELRKRVKQAKRNIDVLLKQRQDELTKLIDAAQETMDQEEELLTEITEAREQAERADTPTAMAEADQQVRGALANFRARVEEYPELKSQGNMMQFQERIADIETQISDRREFYNEATTRYNTKITQFPYNVWADRLGFKPAELFTATEKEKEDVDVSAAFN